MGLQKGTKTTSSFIEIRRVAVALVSRAVTTIEDLSGLAFALLTRSP